jgi:hypothetical protein
MIKAEEVKSTKNTEDMKAKLREMKNKCDELKTKINTENGIDQIQDHCAKLINRVDLRTEILIEQRNQMNQRMIAEIDENEKVCIQTFNDKIGEFREESGTLIDEIDDFFDKNSKYLTQFKIAEKVITNSLENTIGLKRKLNKECDKLQKIKFNNRITQFTNSSFEFEEKLIGSLGNKYYIFDELISVKVTMIIFFLRMMIAVKKHIFIYTIEDICL